ncbi:MAG: cation transporter [Candidatus Micrarchaeota archaeon]|nr:cation transporter [Candidatus Micrarchaeota archaeon]
MHKHNLNGKRIGLVLLFNILITLAEYVGGILSGSLALISDAGHNFSDVLALLLGYIGERFSSKKATKRHSFGLKRFEVFTALINALALWAIGAYIIFESVKRFYLPHEIFTSMMLPIAIIGLIGNTLSILVLHKYKKKNLNMKAAYVHMFYDTISSVFVIISGMLIIFTNVVIFDLIASIVIALMIFWSGFDIIRKSVHIFMQGVPEDIDFEKVYNAINNAEGVRSVHNLHIWSIDSNEIFLSCHICMERERKSNTDLIIKEINKLLEKEFNITHTTIQTENENMCGDEMLCNK